MAGGALPSIAKTGDLPQGVHHASLREVLNQFGQATFIVFGSFVTAKPEPNDVDVFLVMHDTFDLNQVTGEARLLFDHPAAQAHFGASIFWLRQLAALPNEEEAVLGWQLKRDGARRGIVEVTEA